MKLTEMDKDLLKIAFVFLFSILYNLSIMDTYLLYFLPLCFGSILLAKILNIRKDNNINTDKGEK